jgi:hypothetical protein
MCQAGTLKDCETKEQMIQFAGSAEIARRVLSIDLPKQELLPRVDNADPAVLRITIDERGTVIDLVLTSGVNTPALETVDQYIQKWKFQPFLFKDRPICMRGMVYVYFKAADGSQRLSIPMFTAKVLPRSAN